MHPINALGFVEVRGLALAIVAADAMLKSAEVRLIRQHQLNPGLISLVVEGDLAACRAAVDAGMAVADKAGGAVSRLEIGRPDDDTTRMVLDLIERSRESSPSPPHTPMTSSAADADEDTASLLPDALVRFIAESAKGRSISEILRHFGLGRRLLMAELERALAAGLVVKSGSRYRTPAR